MRTSPFSSIVRTASLSPRLSAKRAALFLLRKPDISLGKSCCAGTVDVAMLSVAASLLSRMLSSASHRLSISLAAAYTRLPVSVSSSFLRAPRSISWLSSSCSRLCICVLTVDWVRCSLSAALVKLAHSAVTTNVSSCLRLISSIMFLLTAI